MDIGKLVRKKRLEKGLTQLELATKSEVAEITIRKLENDPDSNPKMNTIFKIADALDVSFLYLCGLIDDNGEWNIEVATKLINSNSFYVSPEDKDTIELAMQNGLMTFNTGKEFDDYRSRLIKLYDQLNVNGQEKAIEQVEMLTKIEEYTKK